MNRVQGTKDITRITDDKLVLNEHERMAQIYMVQNGKKHAECDKNTFNIQKKKTQRINEIAAAGNEQVMIMKIKATGELKLNDSPE